MKVIIVSSNSKKWVFKKMTHAANYLQQKEISTVTYDQLQKRFATQPSFSLDNLLWERIEVITEPRAKRTPKPKT